MIFLNYFALLINTTDMNYCAWQGFTCNANNSLTEISFSNSNLYSNFSIFEDLYQFEDLERLDFYYNNFFGSIPETFGLIKKLNYLDLSSNNLTGTIPDTFKDLTNINQLYLNSNKFYGTLPIIQTRNLFVNDNNFSGNIDFISQMKYAEIINIDNNQLSGTIPEFQYDSIYVLKLSNNLIEGSIPSSIGSLSDLTFFNAENNEISGSIPSSICKNTYLQKFVVGNNKLSGNIPQCLSQLTNLEYLDIQQNTLSGIFPNINNLSLLKKLYAGNNKLDGQIVMNIFPPQIEYIDLSNNYVHDGRIDVSSINTLKYLNISGNKYTEVLDVNKNSSNLLILDTSNNRFLCPYPEFNDDIVFLSTECLPPWKHFFNTENIFIGAGIVLVGIFAYLLFKSNILIHSQCLKVLPNKKLLVFLVFFIFSTVDSINDILMYSRMFNSFKVSKDNCNLLNSRDVFLTLDNFQLTNGDSITKFPDVDCSVCDGSDYVYHNYTSFREYYSVLRSSIIDTLIPNYSSDMKSKFKDHCETFINVKDTKECKFIDEPNNERCMKVDDGYLKENQKFMAYLILSIVLCYSKEFLKFSIIIYSIFENKIPAHFTSLITSSPFIILFSFKSKLLKSLIYKKDNNSRDYFLSIVFEILLENLNQLVLTVYFTLRYNQTGISSVELFTIFSNSIGFLLKIVQFIKTKIQENIKSHKVVVENSN